MTDTQLQEFISGYVEAMLFTETTDDGQPWDRFYTRHHIYHGSWDALIGDCVQFLSRADRMVEDERRHSVSYSNANIAGHDFWLTRQKTGAGFFDGDWPKHGEALTELANSFPERCPYIGDDNRIHY